MQLNKSLKQKSRLLELLEYGRLKYTKAIV